MLEVYFFISSIGARPNLSAESPTLLDRIGNMRKAKIEIYWPPNVLRITADMSSAEYAADDIQSHLKNTEVQKLFLQRSPPHMFDNQSGVPHLPHHFGHFLQLIIYIATMDYWKSIQKGNTQFSS